MRLVKQFCIIVIISFIGEVLHALIPLPVPASIYGLILMFLALMTGVVPHGAVKETGHFLIDIMPIMFIPAGVGLMSSFDVLKTVLLPYAVITVISTFVVMLVSGRVTQWMICRKKKERGQ